MSLSLVVNSAAFNDAAEDRGGNFDPLPPGTYEVELIDAKIAPFAKSGKYADVQAYRFTWKVTEDNETGKNRRLWSNIALIDKWLPTAKNPQGASNFTLLQFLNAIGFSVDSDEENTEIELPDADDLLDANIVIGVDVKLGDEYNGRVNNEVDRYLSQEQLAKRRDNAKDSDAAKAASDVAGKVTEKKNGIFI